MKHRVWLLLCLACLPATAAERERITRFHSDISIFPKGDMVVTEDIEVVAAGNQIRRGIYRDFPTDYRDRHGDPVSVEFSVLGVTRDGAQEAFHTERLSNGVRVYIGRATVFLQPGVYQYRLRYRTDRQLGYFDGNDELYWNVTGNGWAFGIEQASARVNLPRPVPVDQLAAEAYTGVIGAKGRDWTAAAPEPGVLTFETTRGLGAREGLTIVASFPKGVVAQPAIPYWWRLWIMSGLALLLTFAVHYSLWRAVGRDPPARAIYPRYAPPAGMSPSLLRYVMSRTWDFKCLTADLVSMAARGVIGIAHLPAGGGLIGRLTARRGSEWKLRELKSREDLLNAGIPSLSPTEDLLLKQLPLRGGMDFSEDYRDELIAAKDAHGSLVRELFRQGAWFKPNALANLPGFFTSVLGVVVVAWLSHRNYSDGEIVAIVVGLLLCMFIASAIAGRVIDRLPEQLRGRRHMDAVVGGLAALLLGGGTLAIGWFVFDGLLGPAQAALVLGAAVVNGLFGNLMKAYTVAGRKLLDEIEGLRLYLSVAEKQDLHGEREPPLDPKRYQALLGWAMALDVEQAWTRKFTAVAGAAALEQLAAHGGFTHGAIDHLSDFSSSGAASARPVSASSSSDSPGSFSGGGGGGSSGGGGGGGGGGGW